MSLFTPESPEELSGIAKLMEQTEIDTWIGLPSYQGGIEPDTQICLDHLCYYNVQMKNLIQVKKVRGSVVGNRNMIVREALKANVKRVLFIDTDMVFPPDALQRMKYWDKPVVSALAHSHNPPYVPNMYRRVERAGWKPILDWPEKEKLVKVDCIGGAFMLVDVDVLRKIEPPWFASPAIKEHVAWPEIEAYLYGEIDEAELGERIKKAMKDVGFGGKRWLDMPALGEDYYFSEKLRRADIPIHVDTTLKIGHIGKYTVDYQDFHAHQKAGAFTDEINKFGFGVLPEGTGGDFDG